MTDDSTIADFDDRRIGLGAGVRSADGTIRLSCFRLIRTPPEQAIVSGGGALHCPLKSVAASVSGGKTHVPIALIAADADVPWADSNNVIVFPCPCCGRWSSRGVSDPTKPSAEAAAALAATHGSERPGAVALLLAAQADLVVRVVVTGLAHPRVPADPALPGLLMASSVLRSLVPGAERLGWCRPRRALNDRRADGDGRVAHTLCDLRLCRATIDSASIKHDVAFAPD